MKEIVEEILSEEKKAREHIVQIRDRAKQIRLNAEEESRKIIEKARETAQKEAGDYLQSEGKKAHKQRDQELKKAVENNRIVWKEKQKAIEKTVDLLVQLVLGKE